MQSAREIFWSEKKRKLFFKPEGNNDFTLSKFKLNGAIVKSYYCENCRFIITKRED